MEAGREMDVLVAHEVFGYTGIKTDLRNEYVGRRAELPLPVTIPRFSTSIKDAWRVVETLRMRGHWVDIADASPNGWRVSFGEEMTATESAIERAICVAALKAVGHK